MNTFVKTLVLTVTLWATVAHADRTIVVSGTSEKGLDPNMVSMTVEVWSKAQTAKLAQQAAANQYKQVKKVFDDFKIKKRRHPN